MEIFFTFHDFMRYTKAMTYLLMLCSLVGITGFWFFLVARGDKD